MVELRRVTKRFDTFTAVDDVTLEVQRGEFLTLLGPSGCGKTTLLRMISGFETPTDGTVWLEGQDVTALPPYRRNVNQVFQSYALFPHLTVAENIAFGLKMRRDSKESIAKSVQRGIELVSLQGKEHQKPSALSGGQKQRVALARALVCEPKVLLLDEPLSALDAKLRHQMQLELKHLQRSLGITFIFVTHDQEEALTMSDRVALIHEGRVVQIGTPDEIYHLPETRFAAEFIGQANLIAAQVAGWEGEHALVRIDDEIILRVGGALIPREATKVQVSFRPEKIHLRREASSGDGNAFRAEVVEEIFRGQTDELKLRAGARLELTAVVANESRAQAPFHKGDRVWCSLHSDDVVVVRD